MVTKIKDTLNNQFTLYNYLKTINPLIINYLDDNNLNVNFYCCINKLVENEIYNSYLNNKQKKR
jgi:hypothetical protein